MGVQWILAVRLVLGAAVLLLTPAVSRGGSADRTRFSPRTYRAFQSKPERIRTLLAAPASEPRPRTGRLFVSSFGYPDGAAVRPIHALVDQPRAGRLVLCALYEGPDGPKTLHSHVYMQLDHAPVSSAKQRGSWLARVEERWGAHASLRAPDATGADGAVAVNLTPLEIAPIRSPSARLPRDPARSSLSTLFPTTFRYHVPTGHTDLWLPEDDPLPLVARDLVVQVPAGLCPQNGFDATRLLFELYEAARQLCASGRAPRTLPASSR